MKKFFSILLALIMVLSLLPTVAMAEEGDKVAKVGETKYATLAEAISAVSTSGTNTITLLSNIENASKIELPAGVTLDGNNHKISGDSAVYINAGGGTVKNVNFENIHNTAPLTDNEKAKYNLTRTDGKLTAIYGKDLFGTATITGCTFDNVDWDAIQITPVAGAVVSITGNTFKHAADEPAIRYVHIQSNKNVDFSATVTGNKFLNCNKLVETGIEVYYPTNAENVNCSGNYMDAPMGVCIGTGGTSWNNAYAKAFPFKDEDLANVVTIAITVYEPDKNTYFYPTEEEAIDADVVAKIGTMGYKTLAAAVAKVGNGETIKLLKNVDNAAGISVDTKKTFTIDFDNHTYTVNKPGAGSTGTQTAAFQLIAGQTITFKNGTILAAEDNLTEATAPAKNIKRFFQSYANLTLENMTIDGTNIYGENSVIEFANGTVNITGNTSIKAKDGVDAFNVDTWTAYADGAHVTVNTTGTITGNIHCYQEKYNSIPETKSSLTIVNGTFDGIEDADPGYVDIVVKGGSFTSNPIDYVAKGYAVTKTNNTFVVSADAAGTDTAAVVATQGTNGKVTITEVEVNDSETAAVNTVNVSSFETTEVELPKVQMEKLATTTAAAKPVEFVLKTDTSVEFNKEAVQAIAGIMAATTTGDTITLVVKPIATVANVQEQTAMNTVAAGNANAKVFTLELQQSGTNLFPKSTGSTDAEATVTVPFTMPSGCNRVNVYYLNSDTGAAEYVGTASTANEAATFTVKHFSSYALVPTYVGGHGGSYTPSAAQTVTTDLPAGSITKVTVDGKTVDSKYYTISGGNVTLTDAYIKTLSNGKHTVAIENATHISKATITVNNAANAATVKSGKTGDAGILLYGALALMSVTGGAVVIGKKKKHE